MSPKSAGLAVKMGYGNVSVYDEGFPAWVKAGRACAAWPGSSSMPTPAAAAKSAVRSSIVSNSGDTDSSENQSPSALLPARPARLAYNIEDPEAPLIPTREASARASARWATAGTTRFTTGLSARMSLSISAAMIEVEAAW